MVKQAAQAVQAAEPADGRSLVLEKTVGEIIKRFGDGAVMRLGEAARLPVESVPTGSVARARRLPLPKVTSKRTI